jgi:hypothetical protein
MIWQTIRAAIYLGLGVAEVAGDVYAVGKRIARKIWPSEPENPKGLSHKDVAHIDRQRAAGVSHGVVYSRPLTIVPPPKEPPSNDTR